MIKPTFLIQSFLLCTTSIFGQFGTIGYDFNDPYVEFNNLQFAVRLSTENNIYCPDKKSIKIDNASANELTLTCDMLSAAGGQLKTAGRIELKVKNIDNSRLSVSAKASHPNEICKTVLILIKGVDVKSFVSEYPQAKGVKEFSKGSNIMVHYPSRSATMPLLFITTPTAEWFVLSKDKKIRRKGFACYFDYLSKEPVIILSHDEDTRKLSKSIECPEWHIGNGQTRLSIVKERCGDLEENFNLIPYKQRNDRKWIDELKLVAFFHGIHWTGYMFNTYEQMADELEWLCQSIDGKNIMAFLPSWDGRYYRTYPEHLPDDRMGGSEGLKQFVKRAHQLGVKVILMLGGPNLATFKFLKEHDMMDSALKSSAGYPHIQNWLDWNSDLSIETMGLIMNFGHPKYLGYMMDKSGELFDTYNVDGIFLDGTLRWDNSPDYSPYEGLVHFTKEMRKRYPGKLLMGEDGYDAVYGLFDLFHTSAGPLGLENFLLRYTRQFYYLSYPAENGSAGVHEIGWSLNSHTINSAQPKYTIPSISLFNGIIENYGDLLKSKLRSYKNWQHSHSPIMD